MSLIVGQSAPDFTLATDSGGSVTLSALRGRPVVVYFYPKDDTPGCTREACAFRDHTPDFSGADAVIIGISRDTPARHDGFKSKYSLPFTLASDPDIAVAQLYGVWVQKCMYGKTTMGLERSTFLIDSAGVIRQIWRKVKVDGHAEKVLAALQGLG